MNTERNCQICKYYKDGYCENLELQPHYPMVGCDYFERKKGDWTMDAKTLENKMNYFGMERDARKILIDEKLAKPEEVALMTCVEVCDKLLETYEVVSCEDEDITIVKKEDMKTYNNIVRFLSR